MSKELFETAPWMSTKYDMHWRFQKRRTQDKEREVKKEFNIMRKKIQNN